MTPITALKDKNGQPIFINQDYYSTNGKKYQVILDPDFFVAIKEANSGVIEKLYPEVASSLTPLSLDERWETIVMSKKGVL